MSVAASQRLEPEGIAFIGSTYPDVRHGRVLLDPQCESIEVDMVVSLGGGGGFDVSRLQAVAMPESLSVVRVACDHGLAPGRADAPAASCELVGAVTAYVMTGRSPAFGRRCRRQSCSA